MDPKLRFKKTAPFSGTQNPIDFHFIINIVSLGDDQTLGGYFAGFFAQAGFYGFRNERKITK
ncbi:MAG: hypothetical protein H6Q76_842 [Firmicutes bacterium]|nr:hypothetical protein [Bacillota bacterium]